MRLSSWNVNSIKTLRQYYPWSEAKSTAEIFDALGCDILCLQEVKLFKVDDADIATPAGWDGYFSLSTSRARSYAGVATYCRSGFGWGPVQAFDGFASLVRHLAARDGAMSEMAQQFTPADYMELEQYDKEGRVLITDHRAFTVFNVYCPNETNAERVPFKMGFYSALERLCNLLQANDVNVLIAGDINICLREIDHCDPAKAIKDGQLSSFGDTPPRKWFEGVLAKSNLVDTFRLFHPDAKGAYTNWNTLLNARPANYGVRIDYILVSQRLTSLIQDSTVDSQVMGSDHCPVTLTFKPDLNELLAAAPFNLTPLAKNFAPPPLCAKYLDSFSGKQKRVSDFFTKKSGSASTVTLEPEIIQPAKDAALTVSDKKSLNPTNSNEPLSSSIKPRKAELSESSAKKKTKLEGSAPSQRKLTDYLGIRGARPVPIDILQNENTNTKEIEIIEVDDEVPQPTMDTAPLSRTAKAKWADFGRPKPAPNCYHSEPCKEMTVNRKGANQGRRFYVCARPLGASTAEAKEGKTEFKCDFFSWKNGVAKAAKRPAES